MTLEELEERLRAVVPSDSGERDAWDEAVSRFLSAGRQPVRFEDLFLLLPPKALYVGPGPWLDAIRDSYHS